MNGFSLFSWFVLWPLLLAFQFRHILPKWIWFYFFFSFFFPFYSTMVFSWSFSSKCRWRRSILLSTVVLSFLSAVFIPCSSVGSADCLAVFLLLVCLKNNLLLAFMLLVICFSNLLGLTFCFSHLTCQSFVLFYFLYLAQLQLLEFCYGTVDKMGTDWFIRLWQQTPFTVQVPLLEDGSSSTDFSHGCLRFWYPTIPDGWEPWAWPGCFWTGKSWYCSSPSALATSATQGKGQQIKKKKKTVLETASFVSSAAHTAQLGNGSTSLFSGISTFSTLNCCLTAALVAAGKWIISLKTNRQHTSCLPPSFPDNSYEWHG